MLSCDNKSCEYLEGKNFHNRDKLYKDILEKSYTIYPMKEVETLHEPKLDSSIFYINGRYEATLKQTIPTKVFGNLAKEAEEKACKLNDITSNQNAIDFTFINILLFITKLL